MKNGLYSVNFETLVSPGMGGTAHLEDGTISGSDAAYDWRGHYAIDGSEIQGSVTACPRVPAMNVHLDFDEMKLDFVGTCNDYTAEIVAIRRDASGPPLSAVLRLIEM